MIDKRKLGYQTIFFILGSLSGWLLVTYLLERGYFSTDTKSVLDVITFFSFPILSVGILAVLASTRIVESLRRPNDFVISTLISLLVSSSLFWIDNNLSFSLVLPFLWILLFLLEDIFKINFAVLSWTDFAGGVPFTLGCGYSAAVFFFAFFNTPQTILIAGGLGALLGYFGGIYLFNNRSKIHWLSTMGIAVFIAILGIAAVFPNLWPAQPHFRFARTDIFWLQITLVLALSVITSKQGSILNYLRTHKSISQLKQWTDRNLNGIILAGIAFASYFLLSILVNIQNHKLVDTYFEADNSYWLMYLGTDYSHAKVLRAVHPYIYIMVRPLVWLLSPILNGDRQYTILLLSAIFGATSVFLFWKIVTRVVSNPTIAIFFTSIFAYSTSQLVFSSFPETYVYSVFGLLLVVYLLVSNASEWKTILAGIFLFGITITNFLQAAFSYLIIKRNIKDTIFYLVKVGPFCVLLAILNKLAYVNSSIFLFPSDFTRESIYVFSPFTMQSWKAIGRILSVFRTFFFYNILGPQPFIVGKGRADVSIQFFELSPGTYRISEYSPLSHLIVYVWAAILGAVCILILWNLFRRKIHNNIQWKIILIGIICIAINFGLHFNYGTEIFLYSPDWTYALILVIAAAFSPYLEEKWTVPVGLVVVLGVMANNIYFLYCFINLVSKYIVPN